MLSYPVIKQTPAVEGGIGRRNKENNKWNFKKSKEKDAKSTQGIRFFLFFLEKKETCFFFTFEKMKLLIYCYYK